MSRRSIRAYCPRCRHLQPFLKARFDWKLHLLLTVLTVGVWGICLVSAGLKRFIWPWRCEHCGWHEPDFRSPEERKASQRKVDPLSAAVTAPPGSKPKPERDDLDPDH